MSSQLQQQIKSKVMEAILKGGRVIKDKLAELFVKIGIAKPEGEVWPVAKKKPAAKVAKKSAPVKKAAKVAKAKEPVVLLTVDKTPGEKGKVQPEIFKMKVKK